MLKHFLKRDFKTNWIVWAFVVISGMFAWVMSLYVSIIPVLFGLGYIYFLVAFASHFMVLGTQWRSQHCMSRYYLLALPIERKSLYLIMQCRILVHWVPLLLVLLYTPVSYYYTTDGGRVSHGWQGMPIRHYVVYGLGVLSAMIWMVSSSIYVQLMSEKVTCYLIQYKRIVAWLMLIGLNSIEMGVAIGFACGAFFSSSYIQFLCVAGLIVGACLRYLWTRRVWLRG